MQVTQQQVQKLLAEGYSQQEIAEAMKEVEQEQLQQSYAQTRQTDPRINSQQSAFGGGMQQDNLIKWQLELDNILERAEHILRGDKLTFVNGHKIWKPAEDEAYKILNEYGVQEVMKILSMYLNRNTILADYDPQEIDDKVYDFGIEVSDVIFMKYEEMGFVDLEKRKNYQILIREIVDMVHSAYKRALHGGERRSLREARSITQAEQLTPQGININTGQMPRERGFLNPMRYILGRQK